MKRLGVWLPRWNMLKTLLPVMQAARAQGHEVHVLCPLPPLTGEGKTDLLAAPLVDAPSGTMPRSLRATWPWAQWSVLKQAPGSWPVDAVISSGVIQNEKVIISSRVPWVAVDHLHENSWWYLSGPKTWGPWHRICLSGAEGEFIRDKAERCVRTGYTAFDGPRETQAEIREAYGLPGRYLLVGTAVRASTITWSQWQAYFRGGLARVLWEYRGASYPEIIRILRDYCRGTGMTLVGKSRTKHDAHRVHDLFDFHFTDEPTDPARAWRLMQGATAYAGGLSGMAVEALAARVPSINWAYYQPLTVDPAWFRSLRQKLWVEGIWQAPGIGQMIRVHDPVEWQRMVTYLDTVGFHAHYHPDERTQELQGRVIGPADGTASRRVLEACGL